MMTLATCHANITHPNAQSNICSHFDDVTIKSFHLNPILRP